MGHLVTAVNVRHELGLDRVLLEVANRPWQKEGARAISAAEDRFAMVAAAVAGVSGLEASRLEIDRGGVSYTADTLAELGRRHPDAELFTIVGSDAAAGLRDLGALRRGGRRGRASSSSSGRAPAVELPGEVSWIRVVVPHLEVSSTDLRARVVDGRPLDYLVPEDVLAEIRRRGLYAPVAAPAGQAAGRVS